MTDVQRYTIAEVIYEGADSIIYRGRRTADDARVALKILKREYLSPKEIAQLRHEYTIIKDLAIENIVKAYGVEPHGNSFALVMEDPGGRALNEILQAQRLDLKTALQIGASLADTLAQLHGHHVVHKDVKPHNVLVDMATLKVKLTDFGIATRLSQELQRVKSPDLLEGTLAYMSPEQTGRMNRFIDYRTDLYSLGVTLYEMLTGVLPFDSRDPMEIVHSHIARIPPPPREVAPSVPTIVSDIVVRLLAKAAEDRYQSAHGLKVDLEACLEALRQDGSIAPFPLGRKDRRDELRISQKLYGREAELARIVGAIQRVGRGAAELLLIAGDAGVGKSALVNEIPRSLGRTRGHFITGRFDPLDRGIPYAPVAHAFRELARHLLTENAEALARWKARLERALGPNGQLLVDIIPELELILGPQPVVPDLAPAESQNRFNLVFQNFIRVFTAKDRSLVLFLDDLQWADPASLKLIQLLLEDPDSGHLLVIGAYREGEVGADHLLTATLTAIRKTRATIGEITLEPLGASHVEQLVADALGCDAALSAPLAKVISEKTHGNPFFINQLLGALHDDRILSLDVRSGAWVWDLERVQGVKITDNVVAFMAGKIRRLDEATQRVLELAACIGYQFDLWTLAVINEKPPRDTAAQLWPALREGLILPVDAEYRFLYGPAEGRAEDDPTSYSAFNVSYRFLHDRVKEAAYSLMKPGSERQAHLKIGRMMLAKTDDATPDHDLFEIASHLNLSAPLITDRREREELARLDLKVGKMAKARTAYEAAAGYLRAGVALLDDKSWDDEHDLAFVLHGERAECEYLTAHFDDADALFDALLKRARSNVERAYVHGKRMVLHTTLGSFERAREAGLAGLALFGVSVPATEDGRKEAFGAACAEVPSSLGGRPIAALIHARRMLDPDNRALAKLLSDLIIPGFAAGGTLGPLIIVMQVNLAMRHGPAETSAFGYATYGLILLGAMGQYQEGREFLKLALALVEKFGAADQKCRVVFTYAALLHYFEPLRAAFPHFLRARQAGLESGDFLNSSYACTHLIAGKLALGEDLESVRDELDKSLALMLRTKDTMTTTALVIARQLVANLTGQTKARTTLSDDACDEADIQAKIKGIGFDFLDCWYHDVKLQLLYLHGDYAAALAASVEAERYIAAAVGSFFGTEIHLYTCLTVAALYEAADAAEREQLMATFTRHQGKIATYAGLCPANYQHKHLLLMAEAARISGDELGAMTLYDQAITAAKEGESFRNEALASELAARFHAAKQRPKVARVFMTDAYYGYLRWGATAKAEDIAARFPHLLLETAPPAAAREPRKSSETRSTNRLLSGGILDVATVIRAAQAIAGEVELENVLDRLMRIVIKNAGAQRGALILERDGRLMIEATITVDPDMVKVGPATPVETGANLAVSILQYVARTKKPVLLGDAAKDDQFAADPYILANRPKSVLCVSMTHQGRLTGMLYLENNAANDAFTPARLELLELLLFQAATAVENALLYAHVKGRTEELRLAEEQLRLELVERERSEEKRAALQVEIIRVQNERLAELSTPVIPIGDRILVMPLIGMMDAARAQQVLLAALEGVQSNRAAVVILDVTGVKLAGGDVASTLIGTASALRLLGAQAVITGIRPDMAQSLIELQIDFGSIVTRGTLQSGIAYAMSRARDGAPRPRG